MTKFNQKMHTISLFAVTIIVGTLIGYYGRMLLTKQNQFEASAVSKPIVDEDTEINEELADTGMEMGVLEAYLGGVQRYNLFAKFDTPPISFEKGVQKRGDHIFKREYTPFTCTVNPNSVKTHYIVASKQAKIDNPNLDADFFCDEDNDQVEIQSALIKLGDAVGKRVVELTAGTFSLNDQIVLPSNVILKGAGRDLTFLRLQNNANPFRQAGMIRGFQIQDFDITDLTLDGNRAGQTSTQSAFLYGRFGFYCETCLNMQILRVRVTRFYGYGLDPHGEPETAVYSDGLIIDDVIAIDNGWDGMTIDKTLNTVIRNSLCQDNGRHGINLVTGSKDTLIENNQIVNNGWNYKGTAVGNGITIQDNESFGTGRTIVRNNNVVGSAARGIRVDTNCKGDNVSNNRIEGLRDCIYVLNSIDTRIDANNCVGNKKIQVGGTPVNLQITNSGRIGLPNGSTVVGSYST